MSPRTEYNRDELFQPDSMLPEQFFATLRSPGYAKRGEYLLVAAVLEDAIHCYKKYVHARDREGRRLFEDARDWFTAERSAAAVTRAGSTDADLRIRVRCLGARPGISAVRAAPTGHR